MAVSSTTRRAIFVGDGIVTVLPFTFKTLVATDMFVQQTVGAVGSVGAVVTTLVQGTDYTVSLNPDQNVAAGGSITMTVAPVIGVTIDITTRTPRTQGVTLNNAGGFFPQVLNEALDRIAIQTQEIDDQAIVDKVHVDFTASNALASEQKAALSEANAKTSEANAKTSEANAKTSEANAATAATTAATDATNLVSANMQGYVSAAAVSEANATAMAAIATYKAANLPPNYIGKTTDLGLVTDSVISSISDLGMV